MRFVTSISFSAGIIGFCAWSAAHNFTNRSSSTDGENSSESIYVMPMYGRALILFGVFGIIMASVYCYNRKREDCYTAPQSIYANSTGLLPKEEKMATSGRLTKVTPEGSSGSSLGSSNSTGNLSPEEEASRSLKKVRIAWGIGSPRDAQ